MRNTFRRALARYGYEIRKIHPDPASLYSILTRFHEVQPIEIIFDVGANEGQSALEFRGWFPEVRIVSFEPHRPTFAQLRQRAVDDPHWDAENFALGSVQGTADFHENAVSGANSILGTDPGSERLFDDNPHRTRSVTRTTIERLDTYCDQQGIDHIDLLHIDTQGFDLEVLKGCGVLLRPHRIRLVVTEVLLVPLYEQQARFSEILALMDDRGYKLFNLIGGHSDASRGLYWSNALFVGCESG